jgi:hypothetical protein
MMLSVISETFRRMSPVLEDEIRLHGEGDELEQAG